jgi:hypothetical protein
MRRDCLEFRICAATHAVSPWRSEGGTPNKNSIRFRPVKGERIENHFQGGAVAALFAYENPFGLGNFVFFVHAFAR